jgi:6-phosphogluconolactonase
MRVLTRLIASTALALTLSAVAISSAVAAPYSPVVGHLYVNANTAPVNTIDGFARHADGTLTALPGSPFVAGGAGTGAGLASQGALQTSAGGRKLLAVDAGSNEISVLRIRPDGSLVEIGQPVASGGVKPVSIAVHHHLVYVANAGPGGESYSGFVLFGGRLFPIPGSTIALPDGSQAGDILFNSTGTAVAATRIGTSLIDSFRVRGDGRLAAAPGSPISDGRLGPFGSEFRPTDPAQLFVSNAHDGAGLGSVSAFSVNGQASLTQIGGSPFADLQTAPCWVEISHDGRFLFAVNTAVSTISRYAIAPGGALTLLGSTTERDPAGLAPIDPRLDPTGRTLSVVDGGTNQISTFAVNGGNLTELPSSPSALPPGKASGIVVD